MACHVVALAATTRAGDSVAADGKENVVPQEPHYDSVGPVAAVEPNEKTASVRDSCAGNAVAGAWVEAHRRAAVEVPFVRAPDQR